MLAMVQKSFWGRVGTTKELFQCALLVARDESCMLLDEALHVLKIVVSDLFLV